MEVFTWIHLQDLPWNLRFTWTNDPSPILGCTMVYHIFREIQKKLHLQQIFSSSPAKSGTEPGPVRDSFALAKRRAEGCWLQLIQLFGSRVFEENSLLLLSLQPPKNAHWSLESTVDSERFSVFFWSKKYKETEVTLAALERWYRFGSPDRGGRRWTHGFTMFQPTRLWVSLSWAWKIEAWDFAPRS